MKPNEIFTNIIIDNDYSETVCHTECILADLCNYSLNNNYTACFEGIHINKLKHVYVCL